MRRIRKYLSEYFDTKSVFVLDFVLSILSSFLVVLVWFYLRRHSFDAIQVGSNGALKIWMAVSVCSTLVSMLLFKGHKLVIRHASIRDALILSAESILKVVLMCLMLKLLHYFIRLLYVALVADMVLTFGFMLAARVTLIVIYDIYKKHVNDVRDRARVLVYGVSDKSASVVTRLENSPHYRMLGFITDDRQQSSLRINNLPVYVYKSDSRMKELVDNLSVSAILFSREEDARAQENGLLAFCLKNNLKTLILPTLEEVASGKVMRNNIRQVKIEDLLGRDEIKISMDEIKSNFRDKVVMVTGAAGSIGSELCRQLAGFDVRKIILYDNAETPMHNIRLELEERFPELDFVPVIGDVRLPARLDFAFREHRPQIVFHAAAYKHVPLMEENPCEAVLVNVCGSRNVADKCLEYGVEKMVMISTDKAVNPTNIMGCSKRLAEIYVQSLAQKIARDTDNTSSVRTKFVTTRFGNVLGSNGSVIPRFREQIEKGGPVTVTHPEINRFFMTIPEACRLVMEAATMGIENRICVFDMGTPVKIVDLAKRMIELSGLRVGQDIEIEFTGLRPGEKLYEEVLANAEQTDPTTHDRIRIARTREYDFTDVLNAIDKFEELSRAVMITDMVRLMKQVVPEFKSKNSRFEELDR